MNVKGLFVSFILGVALGVVGTLLSATWVEPHLPKFMRTQNETVEGEVVRKQKDPERLLLTVSTPKGSTLASFKIQAEEVELLVEEGDYIALSLPGYEPFVTDPMILHVQKRQPQNSSGAFLAPSAGATASFTPNLQGESRSEKGIVP